MTQKKIYSDLLSKKDASTKSLALLIDPDKVTEESSLYSLVNMAISCEVDYIFVGGSLISEGSLVETIRIVKDLCTIPVIIFPGNNSQICNAADGILLLSLISGRNPDLLIGQHVTAAPLLKRSQLEIISTGYMLIHAGNQTAVQYMSNSSPIPSDKPAIAVCTALAAEMIGMKTIYLEAGSGAKHAVPERIIKEVKKNVEIPVIVGGGIDSVKKAENAFKAGADVLVIGNGAERDPALLEQISKMIKEINV